MSKGRELLNEPDISAESFFDLIDDGMRGLSRFAALQAAVELSLFDHLDSPVTPGDLAEATETEHQVLAPLCRLLADMGLLSIDGERFVNTPTARVFLSSISPYRQTKYVEKLSGTARDLWMNLAGILAAGPVSYTAEEYFGTMSLSAMAENALCGRLQRTVREIVNLPGFASFEKMIDLGGGHGLYAIALARANPRLQAVVFDFPYVTRLAEKYIRVYEADRVSTMAGNFFSDDFGAGYDLILSSSNPSGKRLDMITKIAAALRPGGYFVNVQSMGKESADLSRALEWQLWTLDHEKKDEGRFCLEQPFMTEEYRETLRRSGLSVIREQDIRDDYHRYARVRMIIAEKTLLS